MIRVGSSGWRYEPWRGAFYPEGLPQPPKYYQQWYDETPAGFLFAVKGSRYITHMLRLDRIEKPLANFFVSGILNLRDKLAPFFKLLPRNTQQALALARKRDARNRARAHRRRPARAAARPAGHCGQQARRGRDHRSATARSA